MMEPSFYLHPKSILASHGDTVELTCGARGLPRPNITWFKDGRSVSEAYPSYKVTSLRWGSRLRIRRAKAKDAGIFQCRAKGPGGTATAHAWLKINGFLNTPPITSTVHLIICAYLIDYDFLSKCLYVHCSN